MNTFTKIQAEALAKNDPDYIVKAIRGKPGYYMVWDKKSDHYVEFDNVREVEA